MNYLVVGAGNASRPVARLLNHLGHAVIITDLKEITEFKVDVQRILNQMENENFGNNIIYSAEIRSGSMLSAIT